MLRSGNRGIWSEDVHQVFPAKTLNYKQNPNHCCDQLAAKQNTALGTFYIETGRAYQEEIQFYRRFSNRRRFIEISEIFVEIARPVLSCPLPSAVGRQVTSPTPKGNAMSSQPSRKSRSLTGFERMEDRKLMAVTALIESGKLVINADPAGGTVDVSTGTNQIQVVGKGANLKFSTQSVGSIVFNGSGKVDVFTNGTSKTAYVHGNAGDDVLKGGSGSDYIYGGIGNDTLDGGVGSFSNHLFGGSGNDKLVSGNGMDILFGEAGDDRLFGGLLQNGGSGNDALVGSHQATSMYGGTGSDRFLVVDNKGKPSDQASNDVRINFSNSDLSWTRKEIEQADEVFAQLQNAAGRSTWILKDTLTGDPLKFVKVKAGALGEHTVGRNSVSWSPFDYDRKIQIVDWNENSSGETDARKSTIVHEVGHNWDGTSYPLASESNPLWSNFKALHSQSSKVEGSTDFARAYGQESAEEDWSTVWQMKFGKPGPTNPSAILKAKLAIVDAFFAR